MSFEIENTREYRKFNELEILAHVNENFILLVKYIVIFNLEELTLSGPGSENQSWARGGAKMPPL